MKLRRLSPDDLAAFQAYRNDPDVGRWQGWTPLPDAWSLPFLQEMARVALFKPGRWTQLAIADTHTDALLGDLGVYVSPDGREAEFGFTLARAAQGRGIASAAVRAAIARVFAETRVERIHARTDARNTACLRLLQRLGARQLARIDTRLRGAPSVELRHELARRPADASG